MKNQDNFYQQMNDQLKRIRQKDYSQIDQKLFENMTRADNLNSTLSHLSQFQKFLMEQISGMNQPSKITPNSSIANNISKNFESLRESLVKCSRAIGQNDRKSIASLKKTLTSLQHLVKDLKNDIYQQIKGTCKRVQEETKTAMEGLISNWYKQKGLKQEYFEKCSKLEIEKASLLKEIEELRQINQKNSTRLQSQSQMIFTDQSREIFNHNHPINYNKISINQFQTELQPSYTPLRQQNLNHVPYENGSWKIKKDIIHSEQRRVSVSRNSSNHRLPSKSNINMMKENELLLKKGVKQQRGKSKQKIKLVSMM